MPKTDQKMLDATVAAVTDHAGLISELLRRVTALEAHLADLEERLNERKVFSGARDVGY